MNNDGILFGTEVYGIWGKSVSQQFNCVKVCYQGVICRGKFRVTWCVFPVTSFTRFLVGRENPCLRPVP